MYLLVDDMNTNYITKIKIISSPFIQDLIILSFF